MLALAALAAALAASDPACSAQIASARPVIEHANADWLRAMKSADAAAVAAEYAEDGLFVLPDGSVTRGRAAVQALYASSGKNAARIVGGGITSLGMACGPEGLVYEWGTGTLTATGADGAPATHDGAYLTVWKREGGTWKIARNLTF